MVFKFVCTHIFILINQRVKIWHSANTKKVFINLIDTLRERRARLVKLQTFSYSIRVIGNFQIFMFFRRRIFRRLKKYSFLLDIYIIFEID